MRVLKRPRVLLIGPNPPPMGGMVRYCLDIMASGLAEEFDLTFFPTSMPLSVRPRVFTASRNWSIWENFFRDGLLSTCRQFWLAGGMARELDRLLGRERFDIIHVPTNTGWGFWRNAVHIRYAARHGTKSLFHLLGAIDEFWALGSWLRRRVIRRCLDLADVHVVQSEGLRKITQGFTAKPVLAIYNGVRTGDFVPVDGYAHSDPARGKVRVITVGLLGHRKGHYDLIEAARRLCPGIPELEFLFVGGGQPDVFRKLVADAGLSDKITVAGSVEEQEKIALMRASDIFALPSYGEGQPIAILEAMAAGLPVISTTVGSIPEVIAPCNGRLMAPGDVGGLVSYIAELAGSRSFRAQIGSVNAAEAAAKYSVERTMREIGTVYRRLLAQGPDGRKP